MPPVDDATEALADVADDGLDEDEDEHAHPTIAIETIDPTDLTVRTRRITTVPIRFVLRIRPNVESEREATLRI
jgi:hypothetical protein